MSKKDVNASYIDEKFDNGEEVIDEFDLTKSIQPNKDMRKVNVDFPAWMVEKLDEEAARIGISRQAVIKTWIAEKLDQKYAH